MKIVYFNYLYDLYGISIGSTIKAEELMASLEKTGHEVKIYWRKDQPSSNNGTLRSSTRSYLKKRLARYLHEPNQVLSNLRYLLEENRIINRESPDLIISRLDVYIFSALLLAKIKKIPLIVEVDSPEVYEFSTFHGHQYLIHQKLLKFLEMANIRNAATCFTVSNELKRYFVERGVPEDKLHVISNGADIQRFHPKIDKTTVIKKHNLQGNLVVGFVGSFHYWHGVDNLTKLIEGTLSLDPNIRFLMVGDGGPMKPKLEEFIAEKALKDRVVLSGHIPHHEVPQYISAMDILLAPYPKLDFFYYSPVKIYEYLACGKPVVTTRIGQISEVIADGKNGFLCEPDDVNLMQQRIVELVRNPSLRSSIGESAYQAIVERHSWEMKAKRLSDICHNVLESHRNGNN